MDTVTSVGQIIAIVLAKTKAMAQRYAKEVKIKYEKLEPVLSIEVKLHGSQTES